MAVAANSMSSAKVSLGRDMSMLLSGLVDVWEKSVFSRGKSEVRALWWDQV